VIRRYLVLFVIALLALGLAKVLFRGERPPMSEPARPAQSRVVEVELRDDSVFSRPAVVAVGDDLRLAIVNRTRRQARVSLSGYEDRLSVIALAPDSTWRGSLVADRPGVPLAWLVDGVPRGRFDVAGSHLVAGHQ